MDDERRRKILWTAGLAIAGVVLAGVLWVYGRPAYRHYRETRSLAQAREFFQKNDFRSGALSLQQALQVNPSSLEATHLMAELMAQANSPTALAWWKRVVELAPTTENKLLYTGIALRFEKPPCPIASQMLIELKPAAETNLTYHMAGLQLALKLNRLADAEAHLQAAIRLNPTNQSHRMNLAVLHLQSRDATVAEAARRELATFQADPAVGSAVLRSLITDAVLRAKLTEAKELSLRLLTQTNVTFEDRLQHLTVLEKAKDPELAGWLTRAREEAATNSMRVGQVATWLNGNARPKETVAWVDVLPDTIRTNPAIAMIEADARAQLSDWRGLETRLADQNWADADFMRLAMLSRAFREQGRRDSADANWRRAVGAAEARVGMLTVLVQLAASWNWQPERDSLLWAIVKRSPQEEWAWQTLLRSANQAGDTPSLYRVYSGLLERNPASAELKNNVAFVGLLLNREVEKAALLAHEAYEKNGTNASIVSTLAFALHVQGKTADGLLLFQPLPEAELQKPEIALYYAVLLHAAGQREKAATYAALAEQGQMLPEERRLLDTVKAK